MRWTHDEKKNNVNAVGKNEVKVVAVN